MRRVVTIDDVMRIAARLDRGEITQAQAERLCDDASVLEEALDAGVVPAGTTLALTGEAAARARGARVLAREQ